LSQRGWVLGGESSGHIICLDKTTTGDGIISALQVVAAMRLRGVSLSELLAGMNKLPQKLINVKISRTHDPLNHSLIKQVVMDVEAGLSNKGRVLLRMSGTEPLLRVMVEGEDQDLVSKMAEQIASVVRAELS